MYITFDQCWGLNRAKTTTQELKIIVEIVKIIIGFLVQIHACGGYNLICILSTFEPITAVNQIQFEPLDVECDRRPALTQRRYTNQTLSDMKDRSNMIEARINIKKTLK